MKNTIIRISSLVSLSCLFLFWALTANAQCNKACLSDITEQFLEAKVSNSLDGLPLSSELRVTSNTQLIELGEGLSWEPGITITNRHSFLDPKTQSVVFFGIIAGPWPEVESRRVWWHYALRLTADDEGNLVEIEEHVRDQQDPDTVEKPYIESDIFSSVLPEDERVPESELIAAVESYFDAITYGGGENALFGPDCQRSELGNYRTNQTIETWPFDRFNAGIPSSCRYRFTVREEQFRWNILNRRYYVVDEARGVVAGIFQFNRHGEDGNPPLNVPEAFKIVNGRISYMWAPAFDGATESGWPDWERE